MKVIVAGGRNFHDEQTVRTAITASGFIFTEVVCGGATGVDAIGARLAQQYGFPVKLFPADWKTHGNAAGPIRNHQMAAYADALVAIWDGQSRGTKNMIEEATKRNLKVFVHRTT